MIKMLINANVRTQTISDINRQRMWTGRTMLYHRIHTLVFINTYGVIR